MLGTMRYVMPVEYHWIWVTALLLALATPLIFWRGHRMAYFAAGCALLAAGVACLWIADRTTRDLISLGKIESGTGRQTPQDTAAGTPPPRMFTASGVMLLSNGGALDLEFATSHEFRMDHGKESIDRPLTFQWQHYSSYGYPKIEFVVSSVGFHVQHWGFELFCGNEGNDPLSPYHKRLAIILPDWFVIFILFMPTAYWVYSRQWRLAHYRRLHNLCIKCAYNLAGTPTGADGTRCCSECGTINPAQNRIDAPRTSAQTPPA